MELLLPKGFLINLYLSLTKTTLLNTRKSSWATINGTHYKQIVLILTHGYKIEPVFIKIRQILVGKYGNAAKTAMKLFV